MTAPGCYPWLDGHSKICFGYSIGLFAFPGGPSYALYVIVFASVIVFALVCN